MCSIVKELETKATEKATLKTKIEAVKGLLSNKVSINIITESLGVPVDMVNEIAKVK